MAVEVANHLDILEPITKLYNTATQKTLKNDYVLYLSGNWQVDIEFFTPPIRSSGSLKREQKKLKEKGPERKNQIVKNDAANAQPIITVPNAAPVMINVYITYFQTLEKKVKEQISNTSGANLNAANLQNLVALGEQLKNTFEVI